MERWYGQFDAGLAAKCRKGGTGYVWIAGMTDATEKVEQRNTLYYDEGEDK